MGKRNKTSLKKKQKTSKSKKERKNTSEQRSKKDVLGIPVVITKGGGDRDHLYLVKDIRKSNRGKNRYETSRVNLTIPNRLGGHRKEWNKNKTECPQSGNNSLNGNRFSTNGKEPGRSNPVIRKEDPPNHCHNNERLKQAKQAKLEYDRELISCQERHDYQQKRLKEQNTKSMRKRVRMNHINNNNYNGSIDIHKDKPTKPVHSCRDNDGCFNFATPIFKLAPSSSEEIMKDFTNRVAHGMNDIGQRAVTAAFNDNTALESDRFGYEKTCQQLNNHGGDSITASSCHVKDENSFRLLQVDDSSDNDGEDNDGHDDWKGVEKNGRRNSRLGCEVGRDHNGSTATSFQFAPASFVFHSHDSDYLQKSKREINHSHGRVIEQGSFVPNNNDDFDPDL